MKKLSGPVIDLIEKFDLNRSFFEANEANIQKSDLWFLEAQRIIVKSDSKNIGIVGDTGSGKTVIAMLAAIMAKKRTLLLVPNKQLAFEHQMTFYAMGGKFQTKVITGDFAFENRDWHDEDDRIIFATGHVAKKEIEYGELSLDRFGWIVIDEMHYGSSENTMYARVSEVETLDKIWRTGLTASPGNKVEKIRAVRQNLKLDEFVKIGIPTPGFITSVVVAEHANACLDINYQKAEQLILDQMQIALDKLNDTSAEMSLGNRIEFDLKKCFKRNDLNKVRAKIREFGRIKLFAKKDQKLAKKMGSIFEQYAFWAHTYELFTTESFGAVKHYYQNNLMKKKTWYSKIIQKDGYAQMLLALTNGLLHPKLEMLGRVALSLKARGLRFIDFIDNKATALDCNAYLESLGIDSDCIFSGKGMTPTVKTAILQKSKKKEIEGLTASDTLREGYSLSVDVVLHGRPPIYPIQMTQRNGRAGREGKKGEVIYIVCEHEQWIVPAITRQVKRLKEMDYNSGVMPPLPRSTKVDPQQLRLFAA